MIMKKSLVLVLALAVLGACTKPAPAPEGTIESKESVDVPFYGTTLKYTLVSNCDWKLTTSTVDVTPVKGSAGTTELSVVIPGNRTDAAVKESFTVVFTNADAVTAEKVVEINVPAPGVAYGGYTYGAKYFSDGNYWMTENLHYVPEGVSVSEDPKNGSVWYPYSLEVKEGSTKATVKEILKDDASVAKFGLLYSAAQAFGVEAINKDNYKTLEGTKGICPEGWHIPSRAELFALCGASNKFDGETSAPEDNTSAVLWDPEVKYGNMAKSFEIGFNFYPVGVVFNGAYNTTIVAASKTDVEEFVGMNGLSYMLGSTGYTANSGPQMSAIMSTFTDTYKKGRLNVAYANVKNGVSVRCVLDKK